MPLSVVILAAGQGKRMNSDLPKVLQPLAGRPLLAHVIGTVRQLKPDAIYVVYGHGGRLVQDALHADDLDWVLQAEQLGTGHAVMQAMPLIPDEHTVLVLYGDVPLIGVDTLRKLAAGDTGTLHLLTVELADPTGYGRIVRSEGKVQAIIEERDATPEQRALRETNTGVLAAPAAGLKRWLPDVGSHNAQGEYYLTDVVALAVAGHTPVDTVAAGSAAEVAGINDRLQLAICEAHHRRLRAEELLRAGATLVDPARIDVRGEVSVGRDVFIDVNVIFTGRVSLGDGVRIGPHCVVSDALLGAHTEVFASSVIDGAIVGEDCRVGPFARLRPQTVLADGVHIGNYVEVKATTIGNGSKANHLAYLGDSTVGRGVNIGAGSVTCNYDGLNKWPTFIGDDAFIGSGTMLVAPVRVGTGATIGAGSTLTQSAPDGQLTLERSRQTTSQHWQRPPKFSDEDKAARIDAAIGPKKK